MGWRDAPAVDQSKPKWASAPAVEQSRTENGDSSGLLDQVKRQFGLTGRAVVQGATDLAGIPLDLMASLYNVGNQKPYQVTLDDGSRVTRGGPMELPSQERERLLTAAGLPEPETAIERVVNAAGRGMVNTGGTAQIAQRLPGELAKTMAQRPLMQTVSGATGPGSAATAREMGVGPVGQMVAGIAGAAAPALVSPRAPVAPQPVPNARASAEAAARVGSGSSAAESTVQVAPELRATTGGVNFGTVGPDDSAGLSSSLQRVADRGRELGFRLTPGQATGSRALQQLEAKLESQPMTSGPFNTLKAGNARVLNRAAAAAIGETSDVLDDAVLSRAADRIGDVYDDIADDVARPIEPRGFVEFYSGIKDDVRGLVDGFDNNPLVNDVARFAQDGTATGRQLQSLASKLGKAAYKNMSTPSGDRDMGIALYRVKDYVDDLLAQGLSPERSTAFNEARGQYRNLMLLTQRTGVVNPSTGNVSGRSLANVLQSKDKRGYLYGANQTPMYDAARFAQGFPPIVGDSGTATRMPLQGLTDLVMRVPMNVATRAYTSSPAVNLAVRSQASANALSNAVRGMADPLGPGDIPVMGVGAAASDVETARRRALAEALKRKRK